MNNHILVCVNKSRHSRFLLNLHCIIALINSSPRSFSSSWLLWQLIKSLYFFSLFKSRYGTCFCNNSNSTIQLCLSSVQLSVSLPWCPKACSLTSVSSPQETQCQDKFRPNKWLWRWSTLTEQLIIKPTQLKAHSSLHLPKRANHVTSQQRQHYVLIAWRTQH